MKKNFLKLLAFLAILNSVHCEQIVGFEKLHEFMTPNERHRLFKNYEDGTPDYEVISIKWPKHHKRSDDAIALSLRAYNRDIDLKVRKSIMLLVPPHLPVYSIYINGGIICNKYIFPQVELPDDIYVDEDNFASLMTSNDNNDNKLRIEAAIIGAHNMTIQRVPQHVLNRMGNGFNETDYYIAQRTIGMSDDYAAAIKSLTFQFSSQTITVPDVVYLEVLLMIDQQFVDKHHNPDPADHWFAHFTYLVLFWNQVNIIYKNLDSPKYKITIAGFVRSEAPQEYEYEFVNNNNIEPMGIDTLYYERALYDLQSWLYSHRDCIPLDSYDVAVYHSPKRSQGNILDWFTFSSKLGIAGLSSACKIDHKNKRVEKVALIYDDSNYNGVLTAAHELAHTVGANHDSYQCSQSGYLMSPTAPNGANKFKWSQCSLRGMEQFLRTNPTCLFNVPETYQIAARNKNKKNNSTDNTNVNNTVNVNINNNDKDSNKNQTSIEEASNDIPDVGPYLNTTISGTNIKLSDINLNLPFLRDDVAQHNNMFVIDPRTIPPKKIMLFLLKDTILSLYLVDQSDNIAENVKG